MSTDRYADGSREIQYFTHSMQMTTGSIATLSDVLIKTLNLMSEDPINKALASSLKHDDAVVFETDDFKEASDLRAKMRENGLMFTATAAYKDKVYVVVPKSDLERASEVVNDFYDARSKGMFTAEYLNYYAGGNVMEVKGLKEEEAALMTERCEELHVPVNVEGPSGGEFRIRFAQKDLDKMNRARLDTAIAMCGPASNLYREHLAWKNDYSKAVLNTVITGKFPDGKTVQEGCAVVGSDGKRVEVTKQFIKVCESGSVKSYSRNAGEAETRRSMEEVSRFVKNMENPVFLSSREYCVQKDLDTKDRKTYFLDKERAGFLLPREMYQESIAANAAKGVAPDGSAFHTGDLITDGQGNTVEFTDHGISVTASGKGSYVLEAGQDQSYRKVADVVKEMSNPVYLTAAKAQELEHADNTKGFLRTEEVSQRQFVPGRPKLDKDDMTLIAKSEAIQQSVEIRLKHDGIETPATEKISYHDAAQIFGLSESENAEFQASLSQSISVEAEEDRIGEIADLVAEHYGITEPGNTVIPIDKEIEAENVFLEKDMDQDISFGNDYAQSEFDLDEF